MLQCTLTNLYMNKFEDNSHTNYTRVSHLDMDTLDTTDTPDTLDTLATADIPDTLALARLDREFQGWFLSFFHSSVNLAQPYNISVVILEYLCITSRLIFTSSNDRWVCL